MIFIGTHHIKHSNAGLCLPFLCNYVTGDLKTSAFKSHIPFTAKVLILGRQHGKKKLQRASSGANLLSIPKFKTSRIAGKAKAILSPTKQGRKKQQRKKHT